jgi:hypothetical protein
MRYFRVRLQAGAVLLSGLLAFSPVAGAQTPGGLKIQVVEGEGAVNNVQTGSARDPVVEVRDQNDKPVPGAKVTFSLPERGPGGSFFGAARVVTVPTNEQGRAATSGFRPNLQEGTFLIQVAASAANQNSTAVINQTNTRPGAMTRSPGDNTRHWSNTKTLAVVAIIGATIGVIAATRGSGQPAAATTTGTSVTPGVVTVGTPR